MKEFPFTINYQGGQTTSVTFNIEFLLIFNYLSRINEINNYVLRTYNFIKSLINEILHQIFMS